GRVGVGTARDRTLVFAPLTLGERLQAAAAVRAGRLRDGLLAVEEVSVGERGRRVRVGVLDVEEAGHLGIARREEAGCKAVRVGDSGARARGGGGGDGRAA